MPYRSWRDLNDAAPQSDPVEPTALNKRRRENTGENLSGGSAMTNGAGYKVGGNIIGGNVTYGGQTDHAGGTQVSKLMR